MSQKVGVDVGVREIRKDSKTWAKVFHSLIEMEEVAWRRKPEGEGGGA